MELEEYCHLSCLKDLRLGLDGGLPVAATLAATCEGGVACAHAKDNLGQGEATIPNYVTPPMEVLYGQPYMMIVKLTPEAILMMVRCEEGW